MSEPNSLCVKYTDERYVTKQGFFTALGSQLVDRLWQNVLDYRSAHAARTKLRNAVQLPFCITATEGIKARVTLFREKLLSLKTEFDQFETLGEEEQEKFKRNLLFACLKDASDIEGIKLSEPTLRAMLTGLYREPSTDHYAVVAYRDFLRGDIGLSFDDTSGFFSELLTGIMGTEELVTFYRTDDSTVGMGRAGEYAKYNDIVSLVANLDDFVFTDPIGALPKALLAMFFVDYVQPLAGHNPLLSVALAKKILSRGPLGEFALLLPIEKLMIKTPELKEMYAESAKSGDFTYALLAMIERLNPVLDDILDSMTKTRTDILRKEFRSSAHESTPSEPRPVPVEVAPAAEAPVAEPVAPAEPEPVQEVEVPPSPVEEFESPEEPEEVPVLDPSAIPEPIHYGPTLKLSSREVRLAARYIVETHPDLNKQQALFYATHRTPGRYYTIQDYKKTMKVAYETARTSMDRLASSGLFRKLRIKNKYVYTPRSGEKE